MYICQSQSFASILTHYSILEELAFLHSPLSTGFPSPAVLIFLKLFYLFLAACVFVAGHGLSPVAVSGDFSCCGARALGTWASVVVARGLSSYGSRALERRLSSCGARA